ncbi:hypothetical protein BE21_19135 [Sorangium cellulosum]|uniref:Uncharacterized protein n=1 Tax=Sorangium cellulosum TaxID=56 RepID=A0A150TX87_SORCE|nr:hypothetical protein BE21_19135 [Sorangium cellulosum]
MGLVLLLPCTPALAQTAAALVGTARDAATRRPVPGVVVTATSSALMGARTAVTDEAGLFWVPQLPPGGYTVRGAKEGYQPYVIAGVELRGGTRIQVDIALAPLALAEEITVVAPPSSVDIGSTMTGVAISDDFMRAVPLWRPSARGAAMRSFESLADVAPGVHPDTYGISIAGSTSPENEVVIDGLSVRDPARGLVATPLSAEFVKEVRVATGSLMPEHGRTTGGLLEVITKSGSNELHGSVFSSITPGAFEGTRALVKQEGQTIRTSRELSSLRDAGFELGGPVLRDKLWFYGGANVSLVRYALRRSLNEALIAGGEVEKDALGFTRVSEIPGTARTYYADRRAFHYIGKLTYDLAQDHRAELSLFGSRSGSGGRGTLSIRPQTDDPEVSNIAGTYEALATQVDASSRGLALSLSSSFMEKRLLLDAKLGWHHSELITLPSDGSEIGAQAGLSDTPHVLFRRATPARNVRDYERIPPRACEDAPGKPDEGGQSTAVNRCPVAQYELGGPRDIDVSSLHRYAASVAATWRARAFGHHAVKVGMDVSVMTFDHRFAYAGGASFRERPDGTSLVGVRYGYLAGPDDPRFVDELNNSSSSMSVAGFAQESWNILDSVTLNVGVRYESQLLFGDDGKLGLALHHEWSPRLGVIYDFTRSGRSKVFASYARYHEEIPLYLADRSFMGDRQIYAHHDPARCDPSTRAGSKRPACLKEHLRPIGAPWAPDQRWGAVGSEKAVIDPALRPQSMDEIVLGGEYDVRSGARVGVHYTKRFLNDIVDDISRDDGRSFFIGNPGSGIARDLPRAERDYDAVTLFFAKAFSHGWLAQASYTLSWLRGNYQGLFRPETSQLEPNRNSDYDLVSLLPNRSGPLAGDHRHVVKVFGAKAVPMTSWLDIEAGGALRARSGEPSNYLAAHPVYGGGEVFLLPRGSGDRLPWVYEVDVRLNASIKLAKGSAVTLTADVFNLFNFQAETLRDSRYTARYHLPITGGTVDALPQDGMNPNFGKPAAYQAPRAIRLAARVSF